MVPVGRMLGCKKLFWGGDAWVALGCCGKSGLSSSTSAGNGRFPLVQKDFSPAFTPFYVLLVLFIAVVVLWAQVRS